MAAVILRPAASASAFLSASNPISSLSVIKPNHKFNPAFLLSNASLSIQEPLLSSDPLINSSISTYPEQHAVDYADFLKLEEDTRLSNALISAYLKLGLVDYAHAVFDSLSSPAIISGFAKINREIEAVELFYEMRV